MAKYSQKLCKGCGRVGKIEDGLRWGCECQKKMNKPNSKIAKAIGKGHSRRGKGHQTESFQS